MNLAVAVDTKCETIGDIETPRFILSPVFDVMSMNSTGGSAVPTSPAISRKD